MYSRGAVKCKQTLELIVAEIVADRLTVSYQQVATCVFCSWKKLDSVFPKVKRNPVKEMKISRICQNLRILPAIFTKTVDKLFVSDARRSS